MTLIKNTHAKRLIRDAIVLDFSDLHGQGERILDEARTKAQKILDEAQIQAKTLIDSASDRGFAKGLEEGLAEGKNTGEKSARDQILQEFSEQVQQLLVAWTEALDRWETDRSGMIQSGREDVLTFALALAEKIVYRIVELDPTVIEDQLTEALELLSKPTSLNVAINPADRPTVQRTLPQLVQRLAECRQATLHDDETITPGGCLVRTASGGVDATIETQLDRIVNTLLPRAHEINEDIEDEAPGP